MGSVIRFVIHYYSKKTLLNTLVVLVQLFSCQQSPHALSWFCSRDQFKPELHKHELHATLTAEDPQLLLLRAAVWEQLGLPVSKNTTEETTRDESTVDSDKEHVELVNSFETAACEGKRRCCLLGKRCSRL